MNHKSSLLLALTALSLLALTSSATYITLSPSLTIERIISGNATTMNVSLTNSGDEPAYEVQLSLLLPEGFSSEQIFFGRVDQGAPPQKGAFVISLSPNLLPGKYTAVLMTEYKDANGYPFSSVAPNPLFLKEIKSSQVNGVLEETDLGTKETKKIKLALRNLDSRPHNVAVRVYGPKELKITPGETNVYIDSRGEASTDFEISPFGALKGSTYVVFASMDYEEDGVHYSSTGSGIVRIVEKKDLISFSGWLPVIDFSGWVTFFVVVILLGVAVYYQFIKK